MVVPECLYLPLSLWPGRSGSEQGYVLDLRDGPKICQAGGGTLAGTSEKEIRRIGSASTRPAALSVQGPWSTVRARGELPLIAASPDTVGVRANVCRRRCLLASESRSSDKACCWGRLRSSRAQPLLSKPSWLSRRKRSNTAWTASASARGCPPADECGGLAASSIHSFRQPLSPQGAE